MPKSYSDKERGAIINALRNAAFESMIQKGIKKTTVDELVAKVHIPKGTFYLFYNSKELLLYDAIMQKEDEIHRQLADKLKEFKDNCSVDSLTDLLFDFFNMGFSIGILPLMISGELDILMRKLPDEVLAEHISKDYDFLLVLQKLFPALSEHAIKHFSAAFRASFLTIAYKREIGENYDDALKLLIKGLVIQMWEDRK